MASERATKKQQELFQFVKDFIDEHDYGPSYREIMFALGYKSVSTVAVHVDALIAKGYLARRDNSPRSLEVAQSDSSSTGSAESSDDVYRTVVYLIKSYDGTHDADESIKTLLRALELVGRTPDAKELTKQYESRKRIRLA
ncbi:MAG: hypothetical protein ACSLEY_02255 [Candidatus Saccharimonadales bacterium]